MAANPRTATVPITEPLVKAPFAEWKYKDAADAVSALVPEGYQERRDYASDQHWSAGGTEGAGWVGPQAVAGSVTASEVTAAIKRQFAPYDACGEVLAAIEDAFSMEAQIGAVPIEPVEDGQEIPKELQNLAAQAVGILTTLWDRVRLHEELKPAIRTAAWAERAGLRWWIPPGRALRIADSEGRQGDPYLPPAGDFEQAAEWLALSRPMPDAAAIVTDEPTQERAAVYLDEISEGGTKVKRAVVAYADGEDTVWRTLYENESKEAEERRLPTGGVLPIAEMRGDNLLTPSVIATQKQLDYAESVVTRTVETAGFRERYISNAEPTGVWVRLASGEVPSGPAREFNGVTYQLRPSPRTLGASITTELVGIVTNTDDAKQVRATPSVESFDPTDPEFAIKVGQHARAKILTMCRQGHRAMASTAESSGFAYQQARAAFEKDLGNRKGAAEGLLRDLLTAALGMIEGLTGNLGYFTNRIRLTVDMHVDAGPRSPEERSQDREDVKASLLSLETAISRGGVEDVQAELEKIFAHPMARLAMLEKAATVMDLLTRTTSEEAAIRALIAAGVDEDLAEALRRKDTDGGAVEQ